MSTETQYPSDQPEFHLETVGDVRVATSWHPNGALKSQGWYLKVGDELWSHREMGPAFVSFRIDGSPICVDYFKYNKPHKIGGPAMVIYDENGKVIYSLTAVDGNVTEVVGDRMTALEHVCGPKETWFTVTVVREQ